MLACSVQRSSDASMWCAVVVMPACDVLNDTDSECGVQYVTDIRVWCAEWY